MSALLNKNVVIFLEHNKSIKKGSDHLKTFYADYANHILRFFTRHSKHDEFRSEADKLNYVAAEKVFAKLNEDEQLLLIDVYRRNDTMADNVYEVAKARGINQDEIWILISKVSNRVARERKLI